MLDLCALAIPSQDAASGLPFGITLFALAENEGLVRKAAELIMRQEKRQPEKTMVAVCGLHMRGYPLEKQMLQSGARFLRATRTAKKYQFIKLSTTPAKPGLVKKSVGGCAIEVELWEMPIASFGSFASSIPSPLGIGKIELADGSEVPGFICEGYAADEAMDISAYGSWRRVSFT